MRVLFMHDAKEISPDAVIAEAHHVVGTGPVYSSFDIDALDPAHAACTRIPKVGGFTHQQAAADPSWSSRTGLCRRRFGPVPPPFNHAQVTALMGATLMYETICLLEERVATKRDD
ncbi:arginase family protein [Alphaproteobacteria bacterium]|nr:arginase family protein [Alphaproteobacteria bacterium]